jgi:hypothetical protein
MKYKFKPEPERQPTQQEICEHLQSIAQKLTGREELEVSRKWEFVIGKEMHPKPVTSARYFPIVYNEVRSDSHFLQCAPTVCRRKSYLEINQEGTISLKDSRYLQTDEELKISLNNAYNACDSSSTFYFKENKLQQDTNWEIAGKERVSSHCVKRLAALTLVAIPIIITYGVMNGNIQYNKP